MTLEQRLAALEGEVRQLRRRSAVYRAVLLALVATGTLLSAPTIAASAKRALTLESEDGHHALLLTPDALEFQVDGHPRMRLEVGADFATHTVLSPTGAVLYFAGSDLHASALRLFSPEGTLRAEISERLIDSGSGLRLYDPAGNARVSLYSSRRSGESGLELTDPSRQPRVGIYAKPDGASVIQASTSDASAELELSVLPLSDVQARLYGGVPSPSEGEALVPMVFLVDGSGRQANLTTLPN